MGINRGSSAVTTVKRGTSQVSKIFRGLTQIWANILSGQLYVMTGSSSPSPFVASDFTAGGYNMYGEPYQVFDNNGATYRHGWYTVSGQRIGASLNFNQNIKILKIHISYYLFPDFSFNATTYVDAYDPVNGVWRNIYNSGAHSQGYSYEGDITISSDYTYSQIRMYSGYISGSTAGAVSVIKCQVIQWSPA